jgi:hypothetical protein
MNWRAWNWRFILGITAAVAFALAAFEPQYAQTYFLQAMAVLALALTVPQPRPQ